MNATMEVARLTEDQNANFDREFHAPGEMAAKVAFIRETWANELEILDLGGGNGVFIDRILDEIPFANGTILDVSKLLVDLNAPSPRKKLVVGAIEDAGELLKGQKFDVVCFNWVLHHLVGENYEKTTENCLQALRIAQALLKPGGMISVAETRFEGVLWSPGWLVFQITRVKQPSFAKVASRFFNTAGVGVCFRSEAEWSRLVRRAGLVEKKSIYGAVWPWRWQFIGLGLREQQHKHMFLAPRG